MRVLLTILMLTFLAGVGCVHKAKRKPPGNFEELPRGTNAANPQHLTVQQEIVLVGKIVSANPTGRFVIVNFPLGRIPPQGQRFSVYRRGLKVGEIRINGPQRDDNIAGDLTAGEATVGDEVRER